jgi:L-fuculokinase
MLTGQKLNDISMLGTSMLSSIDSRGLSGEILKKIDFPPHLFGRIGEAAEIVGLITPNAAEQTGIPGGTMVCLAGHDTQFAIFGSGAETDQPVLSSGTWEILMARSKGFSTTEKQLKTGITTEFDAIAGVYNIGLNWLGSGIIEWVRRQFYSDCSNEECYDVMINEAMKVEIGSNGIFINPDFNSLKNETQKGQIIGLTLYTHRSEIFRAVLEALSYQLRLALFSLEDAGSFKAFKIICVGGGSRNRLWNQIRADVLGLPVVIIDQKETTVLGASFFAFTAAGIYSSASQAREKINYNSEIIIPSENAKIYNIKFKKWNELINQA